MRCSWGERRCDGCAPQAGRHLEWVNHSSGANAGEDHATCPRAVLTLYCYNTRKYASQKCFGVTRGIFHYSTPTPQLSNAPLLCCYGVRVGFLQVGRATTRVNTSHLSPQGGKTRQESSNLAYYQKAKRKKLRSHRCTVYAKW